MADTTNTANIFKGIGSVSYNLLTDESNKYQAFIAITVAGSDTILLGKAPVTGVQISQLTDFSITKSLDKDFLVATFGDTPTRIQLNGISFFNLNGCELSGDKVGKQQVLNFYRENKLSANPKRRIDIAVASGAGEKPVCFRCVLVGLDAMNSSNGNGSSNVFYTYSMTLIGVERQ